MGKYDILCLEWSTKSRDSNILMPVLVYLKKEKKYQIKVSSLAYAVLKLLYYRPKMLLVANPAGAPELNRVIKYAYFMGIKTVSLISEGNVVDDPIRAQGYFWGWNFEKKCYLDLFLLWSERSRNIFEQYIPESSEYNMKISGATGFDKYQLLRDKYMTKEVFREKYHKKYKKVIGIASAGFSIAFVDQINGATQIDDEVKKFLIKSCLELRKIIYDTVCYFDDILFALRPHPGEISEENEFLGLQNLKNVVWIHAKDEQISDNINVCDIWMAYDSTTCMEAWLLDKPALLINPFPIEYSRSIIYKGSPIARNACDVISYIEEFYRTGKIEAFDCLQEEREQIIQDVIGYSDGRNYKRAGDEIIAVMNSDIKRKGRITRGFLGESLKDCIKWIWHHSFLIKIKDFEQAASFYRDFDPKECEEEEEMYYNAIYGEKKYL